MSANIVYLLSIISFIIISIALVFYLRKKPQADIKEQELEIKSLEKTKNVELNPVVKIEKILTKQNLKSIDKDNTFISVEVRDNIKIEKLEKVEPNKSLFKEANQYFEKTNWNNKLEEKIVSQNVETSDLKINSLFFRSSNYFNLFNWSGKEIIVSETNESNTNITKEDIKSLDNSKALFYDAQTFFKNTSWENKKLTKTKDLEPVKQNGVDTKSFVGSFLWD
ncbi:MAG: hypothetical protein H7263_02175 [Candidatus Sericytochromatia bacterium]|nr:hypothetical protein [Candidatus Sericytochromatia bacterium]